jgi:hypothetical protein
LPLRAFWYCGSPRIQFLETISLVPRGEGFIHHSSFCIRFQVVRGPQSPYPISAFSFQRFSFSPVGHGPSPGFVGALWELCGSLVGALWEPCGSLRDALGWLCRRFRVALGSQSVGYQQALGWPWGGFGWLASPLLLSAFCFSESVALGGFTPTSGCVSLTVPFWLKSGLTQEVGAPASKPP